MAINPISTATQGLLSAAASFNTAAVDVTRGAPGGLEKDFAAITTSKVDFAANAKVVKVASNLQKYLINFKT